MSEPRIRSLPKVKAPYDLNNFPEGVIESIGRQLVGLIAVGADRLEGPDWEKLFAAAIDADWHPTNNGLTDVRKDNCAWSAKTVKNTNPFNAATVRLISGRNSLDFSYQESNVRSLPPEEVGRMVLAIWNRRLADMRTQFEHLRTVVLIKHNDFRRFALFEFETVAYEPSAFRWSWNSNSNLVGHSFEGKHRFTWQPHGSQFTVVEDVPAARRRFQIHLPPAFEVITIEQVLDQLGFDPTWIQIVS